MIESALTQMSGAVIACSAMALASIGAVITLIDEPSLASILFGVRLTTVSLWLRE